MMNNNTIDGPFQTWFSVWADRRFSARNAVTVADRLQSMARSAKFSPLQAVAFSQPFALIDFLFNESLEGRIDQHSDLFEEALEGLAYIDNDVHQLGGFILKAAEAAFGVLEAISAKEIPATLHGLGRRPLTLEYRRMAYYAGK